MVSAPNFLPTLERKSSTSNALLSLCPGRPRPPVSHAAPGHPQSHLSPTLPVLCSTLHVLPNTLGDTRGAGMEPAGRPEEQLFTENQYRQRGLSTDRQQTDTQTRCQMQIYLQITIRPFVFTFLYHCADNGEIQTPRPIHPSTHQGRN